MLVTIHGIPQLGILDTYKHAWMCDDVKRELEWEAKVKYPGAEIRLFCVPGAKI